MKKLLFLFIFLLITNCNNNKNVYWCGDHPCINKKEKQAYFKKTMIVEIRNSKNTSSKNKSEIEKITQQAKFDEKKRIKDEKNLAKKARLQEKERIKQEKLLTKQAKIEKSKLNKNNKKLSKEKINEKQKKQSNEISSNVANAKGNLYKFKELVEKITKKNTFRPYPDINDIPD